MQFLGTYTRAFAIALVASRNVAPPPASFFPYHYPLSRARSQIAFKPDFFACSGTHAGRPFHHLDRVPENAFLCPTKPRRPQQRIAKRHRSHVPSECPRPLTERTRRSRQHHGSPSFIRWQIVPNSSSRGENRVIATSSSGAIPRRLPHHEETAPH